MAQIRPETEVDRTEAALAAEGLALPLRRGDVAIEVAPGIERTGGGQRLVTLLVNELARMKGVVRNVNLTIQADAPVQRGTPLTSDSVTNGLGLLVDSLNSTGSSTKASITFGQAIDPTVRVQIGIGDGVADIVVAADAWRALFGRYAAEAGWSTCCPIGPALGAAIAAAEIFKLLVAANGGAGDIKLAPPDFSYSGFNYGQGVDAAAGPDVATLELGDLAIVGCGAGGSGTAYVLAMHPALHGTLALIEPGVHKLSNLNRYLASTAEDVHRGRHKLSSLVHHLASFAPALELSLAARPWEQLDRRPWRQLVCAVDTVESRWQIQRRALSGATIIDLAVNDLLYALLRVTPGGRCLFCKHPYDPDLGIKQRAARWGVSVDTIRQWLAENRPVDREMLASLTWTQGRESGSFNELLGATFSETPPLLECGSTSLRADVPSQAPVLPIATTVVAIAGAAEIIKAAIGAPGLGNWLAHDLRRNPTGPWRASRGPVDGCPEHGAARPSSST
jgi:molybdopterin/thiamine biosynthesis adenylyltransferase